MPKIKSRKGVVTMSDRYIASSVRYGIKDTIKDKFLELEEIADLLNNAEDNGLLVDKKILLVEDGSVDVEKLEASGFYCIVYRQGAEPPILIKE